MPIQIKCGCGKSLRVKDELAGKKVRCPGCSVTLVAPPAEDAIVPVLAIAPPRKTPPKPIFEDEEEEQTAVTEKPSFKATAKAIHDDGEAQDDRSYSRKKRRRGLPDGLHTSRGGGASGIGAGVGLMVVGVVLFVGPLAFGYIVPYAAILFVAGIVTLVQAALRR